jgi:molybdate transport system ATP-binding protein
VQVTNRRGRFLVTVGHEKRNGDGVVPTSPDLPRRISDPLIHMKDVQVRYNGLYALKKMTWSMRAGENWAILGPNGSGKSTILKLIMGDNPQAYANNVTVLGKKKGSGETVWEIKRNIGIVSSEFQIAYRKRMRAYDVIVSGFFDSVGLYRHPTAQQREVADRWIQILDIGDIAKEEFDRLSYGQRRMILLARAMVKSPALLILDEPCHGLDIVNQLRVLKTIETIGQTRTQILYVTHREEEILSCITHVMQLKKGRVLSQGRKEKVLS